MGKRRLLVSTELLVEFLKNRNDQERTFTVERGLPDDARVVQQRWLPGYTDIEVVLESATWAGDSDDPLAPPLVRVHTFPAGYARSV